MVGKRLGCDIWLPTQIVIFSVLCVVVFPSPSVERD